MPSYFEVIKNMHTGFLRSGKVPRSEMHKGRGTYRKRMTNVVPQETNQV